MSLTRRHFLGLLGAAPALAPVAALAVKREPEPKFPRWFLVIDPRWIIAAPTVACILVSAPDRVYSVRFDGQRERRYCYDLAAKKRVGPTRLDDVFEGVSLGLFREITAAEAKALLKPRVVTIEDLDEMVMTDHDRYDQMVRQMTRYYVGAKP